MIRIVAGAFRGRMLKTPKGEATRPTSGVVRESLFNILAARVPGSRFLDLFAGSGSVGLEALSRGAAVVTLVEHARPALACLRANISMLNVNEQTRVLPSPVERMLEILAAANERFDLIFLDPPFANADAYLRVLERVASGELLAEEGLLIAQHDVRLALPEKVDALTRYRLQRIGDNALSFYREG